MVNVIKAPFQIGIQDILGLVINDYPDSCDGILTGASRAEAITICLKFGFPGWFERKLHEGLMRSCLHYGNTKRALFGFVIRLVPLSSISPCSRLHILGITPGIRFLSNPSLRGIGWHLLVVSTTGKSRPESYPVPMICFALR